MATAIARGTVRAVSRTSPLGTKATSITQDKENIDVVVKLNLNADYTSTSDTAQTTIDSIKNLSVAGTSGTTVWSKFET